jgi:hypothetical protein
MYTYQDLSISELVEIILPKLQGEIAKEALQYGSNRGGLAVGFKDKNGNIHSIVSIVNPDLPSRWGDPEDQYDLYAGLKLGTALRKEAFTERLDPEKAPLMAIHPGAVVRFHEGFGVWIGVAYSGHKGEEDRDLALKMLNTYFFNE